MNTVVTYDIVSDKRRNRFHRFLKELGIPSQYSVFECRLDPDEVAQIRHFCRDELDLNEDSVRIYRVCATCMEKAEIQGKGITFSRLDWAIV